MHAVVLEYPPMTPDLPVEFELLETSFERCRVCFGLHLRNSIHITLRLPRRCGMNCPAQQVKIAIFFNEGNGFSILFMRIPRPSLLLGIPDVLNSQKSTILRCTKIPLATKFGCISLIPLAFFSRAQECPLSIVEI